MYISKLVWMVSVGYCNELCFLESKLVNICLFVYLNVYCACLFIYLRYTFSYPFVIGVSQRRNALLQQQYTSLLGNRQLV